ncbi:tautomerase family protein [Bradyrhizobium erythrophlei]|uniref:tautomerase family protein n=1 Tax=Bradyrhizobium erythrophlei TaxID=1437360 RepID=UPI001FCD81CB|nr:tautomerase family protein [Bradyrhizobium erythrophlei]
MEDTGLGFVRSENVLLLQVTSRSRNRERKENFNRLLIEKLGAHCGIAPDDIIVSFVTKADEDWSFGAGGVSDRRAVDGLANHSPYSITSVNMNACISILAVNAITELLGARSATLGEQFVEYSSGARALVPHCQDIAQRALRASILWAPDTSASGAPARRHQS